jgi:hypothetical protein
MRRVIVSDSGCPMVLEHLHVSGETGQEREVGDRRVVLYNNDAHERSGEQGLMGNGLFRPE